jgi:hypothetical protein
MAKYITPLIFIIFFFTSVSLSDFRSREKIAPGVIYYHDHHNSGPWHIHVLEIDLSNSVMSEEMNSEDHYIVGAINADFFEWNGKPVGAQVINELLINEPISRSVFGMTVDKKPFIDIVSWRGQLFISKEIVYEIKGLNRRSEESELILFNSYYNADTLSYTGGTVIHAELFSDEFALNDTIDFQITGIVESDDVIVNPSDILKNEIILVGPDHDITDFNIRDKIQILINLFPVEERVDQLVGGLPRLIRDGNISIDWEKERVRENFSTKRHPRTAVGYTEDKQKVLLFVVDGRQPGYSMGMTLPKLADYMLDWNVYQGVNLDGGGSTTMVVHGGVVNKPSDAEGERAVANALMVVNIESNSSVMKLNINPDEVVLSPGASLQFNINVQDINFHPIIGLPDSAIWYCDPGLGRVDSTGFFTAGTLSRTGYLYVQTGIKVDSAKVSIIKNLDNKPLK